MTAKVARNSLTAVTSQTAATALTGTVVRVKANCACAALAELHVGCTSRLDSTPHGGNRLPPLRSACSIISCFRKPRVPNRILIEVKCGHIVLAHSKRPTSAKRPILSPSRQTANLLTLPYALSILRLPVSEPKMPTRQLFWNLRVV